jgi:hypothetical protein
MREAALNLLRNIGIHYKGDKLATGFQTFQERGPTSTVHAHYDLKDEDMILHLMAEPIVEPGEPMIRLTARQMDRDRYFEIRNSGIPTEPGNEHGAVIRTPLKGVLIRCDEYEVEGRLRKAALEEPKPERKTYSLKNRLNFGQTKL